MQRTITRQRERALEAVLQQASLSRAQLDRAVFSKLKHFRRVAARYNKLAANSSPWSSSPQCRRGAGLMTLESSIHKGRVTR